MFIPLALDHVVKHIRNNLTETKASLSLSFHNKLKSFPEFDLKNLPSELEPLAFLVGKWRSEFGGKVRTSFSLRSASGYCSDL